MHHIKLLTPIASHITSRIDVVPETLRLIQLPIDVFMDCLEVQWSDLEAAQDASKIKWRASLPLCEHKCPL